MPRARMPSARRHACQCGRNARGSKGLPSVFTKTKVSVLTRIGSMERRTCMVFREKVHGALGPPGLRGAVLVEVAGADDCEPRAVEIDVAPAEACRLGRSHPGPEERVHVGVVRRVRPDARPLLRLPRVEPESLVSEPRENPPPLLRGGRIGVGGLAPPPGGPLQWICPQRGISNAGLPPRRP